MIKLKQMILMLCLILSGALCYANIVTVKDGHPVSIELSVRLHTLTITYYVYHLINPNPSDQ